MALELNRDPDFMKRRTEFLNHKREEDGSGKDFIFKKKVAIYNPKEGDRTVRFMEGTWPDPLHYGYDVFVHYQIGPNKGNFICAEKMPEIAKKFNIKAECPICQLWREASAKGDEEAKKAYTYSRRTLAYVIDRDNENEGPLVWSMPYKKVGQALVTLAVNKRTGSYLFIEDPKEGNDVSFTKKGKGLSTSYEALKIEPMACPLSEDDGKAKKWIEYTKQNPIPELLLIKDADYIKKVLEGMDEAHAETDSGEKDNKPITSEATKREEKAAKAVGEEKPKEEAKLKEEAKTETKSGTAKPSMKELGAMSREKLLEVIEKHSVDIDVDSYSADEDLAAAIAIELNVN